MSELCRWYRYTTWPQPINMRITRGWNAQPDICIGTCRTTWDLYNTWCRRLLVSLIVKCILKTSFEFIEEKVLTFTYNFYINLLEQNMKQFKLLYIKICRYKILMEKNISNEMYNPLIISFIFYRSTTMYSERFYWKNYHFIILLDIFQCEIFFRHKTKWKIQLFVTQKIQLIDIFCYRLYSDSLRTHFPLEGNEDQFVAKKAQTKSVTLTERPMETFRSDLRQIVSSYARPISILL